MKPLPEIDDFHLFLAHLLVEMSKNEIEGVNQIFAQPEHPWFTKKGLKDKITSVPFWLGKLGRYNIAAASTHENFTDYASTHVFVENPDRNDVFADIGFANLNTVFGVMVIFFDEYDSLYKLELHFRVEKPLPSFLLDLVRHFPNEDPQTHAKIITEIEKIGTIPIEEFMGRFKQKTLNIVELE
ncbi:MAG TPA: hypothetical protein ACFCUC_09245 [Desulfobacterales bacterium]